MAIVHRGGEQRLIASFLDAAGPGVHALVLEGEAGIGKTTLWQAAMEAAAERGYRVLVTRPTQAEARLPFAALHDLFGELSVPDAIDLPAPQRTALDAALMRTVADDAPIHPLALSIAVLELVRAVASTDLCIAIDDVQWLDESSASVLGFALRRITDRRVLLVASHRTEPGTTGGPSVLEQLGSERLTRIAVRGLSREGVDRLLDASLGLRLPPTALARVHRAAAGNPLHALEIGRALVARGTPLTSEGPLPVPASLAALVAERLSALPDEGRDVVRVAAALGQPTTDTIAAAVGADAARAGIEAAQAAGVLRADGDSVRFVHPLLASEALEAAGEAGRREIHRRLAEVVKDEDQVARHRALAATEPDPDVAVALARAADHAAARGAPDAAANLFEEAARLTPASHGADRVRRRVAAGRHLLLAGDAVRARTALEALLDDPDARGTLRAEVLHALAVVRMLLDDFAAARSVAEEALAAAEDPELTIQLRLLLAGVAFITGAHWSDGERHAATAMRLAEAHGDASVLAGTIGHHIAWRFAVGRAREPKLEERALELAGAAGRLRPLDRPEYDVAAIAHADGDTAGAEAHHRHLLELAERGGDYTSLPYLQAHVAMAMWHAGRRDEATARMDLAERLAEATGQRTAEVHVATFRARLSARWGDADRAHEAADRAWELMARTGWRIAEWAMRADLALLELSCGRPEAALALVGPAADPTFADPTFRSRWAVPAAADALVALGRVPEAEALLATIGATRRRHVPDRLRVEALRSTARASAASGDAERATAAVDRAEAAVRATGDRWELAHTLLVAGEVHRRARRRARARDALAEAVALFEALHARLWAARAREELGRIGSHRGEAGVTPTQREVAALAASGLTNREIGDRLFMSPHTVEAHLSAVYRQLEIRSRAELEGALARLDGTVRDSAPAARDSGGDAAGEV